MNYEIAKQKFVEGSNSIVEVEYNPENSELGRKLNQTRTAIYSVRKIVERGVLIGGIGHLQLIEWPFVKDIR